MPNLECWGRATTAKIEQRLNQLLSLPSKCSTLLESMRYSSLDGGKRIRPQFTIASGSLSNAVIDVSLTIGCAIELIHCFSLIHDDLPTMDNDDLRRGRPTNHKVYGEAVALLSGDALHAFCFEILSAEDLALPAATKLAIIRLVAQSIGVQGMVGGQTIDWLSTAAKLSLEQLQEMHTLKTGALLRAAILAGYLAGANFESTQYHALDEIAQKIGLLFQIIDDIIDTTEDSATLGKTANKDLINNKATYVSILGLTQAKATAAQLHAEIVKLLEPQSNSAQLKYLADSVYYRNS